MSVIVHHAFLQFFEYLKPNAENFPHSPDTGCFAFWSALLSGTLFSWAAVALCNR